MVSMADFELWDDDLPAKQALFLLDACFSGLAGMAALSDEKDLEIRDLSKPGHHIISAGRSDEQTIASRQEWQGSVFTHALLKALSGQADQYGGKNSGDGVINLHELVADMGETVKHAKAAVGWNRPLRPVLNAFPGRGEGQFFFLTNEKKRTYLVAQGKQVGNDMAYGMPVVVMGARPAPECDRETDRLHFEAIKNETAPGYFEAYLKRVTSGELCGLFADIARLKLKAPVGLLPLVAEPAPHQQSIPVDPSNVEAALALRPEDRLIVQQALDALEFRPGVPDGVFGANTRRAILRWQRARSEEPTGYLTSLQYTRLLAEADPLLSRLDSTGPSLEFASEENFTQVYLTFVNKRSDNSDVFWVDFDGNEIRYCILKPYASCSQRTYTGHQWIIKTDSGQAIGHYFVNMESSIVNIPSDLSAP